MKNKLSFQTTEYDCGPTTLVNALRFLYEREEIVPELLKNIALYTLDLYDDSGESGKSGTSRMAMMFLSNWFNHYAETKKFPIQTEFLISEQVYVGKHSKIVECLQQGGAVILCVWLEDCKHYLLLTGVKEEEIFLFDPYDWEGSVDQKVICSIKGEPYRYNRKVPMDRLNEIQPLMYALGKVEDREAMLLFNTNTRKTPERSIEFFI